MATEAPHQPAWPDPQYAVALEDAPDRSMSDLARVACGLLGMKHALLYVSGEPCAWHQCEAAFSPMFVEPSHPIVAHALRERRPIMVDDVAYSPLCGPSAYDVDGVPLRAFVSIPLFAGSTQELIGCLAIFSESPHELKATQVADLVRLGRITSDSLNLRRRAAELAELERISLSVARSHQALVSQLAYELRTAVSPSRAALSLIDSGSPLRASVLNRRLLEIAETSSPLGDAEVDAYDFALDALTGLDAELGADVHPIQREDAQSIVRYLHERLGPSARALGVRLLYHFGPGSCAFVPASPTCGVLSWAMREAISAAAHGDEVFIDVRIIGSDLHVAIQRLRAGESNIVQLRKGPAARAMTSPLPIEGEQITRQLQRIGAHWEYDSAQARRSLVLPAEVLYGT